MDNTWVIKNTLVLEVSFTDYILALYVLCLPYALSSFFVPCSYKKARLQNKVVSPCRDCLSVVLSGSPFPSPEKENSHREKQQVTYKGNPRCLTADLSAETLQARREWQDIVQVLKGKNLQPRLLYPARLSFETDGEIKSFSDKQKLREFGTTKPALQKMLKGLI